MSATPVVYNVYHQRDDYRIKFAFQLLFFAITTLVGLWATTYAPLTDLLTPADEREQMQHAKDTINSLISKKVLGREAASALSTHELRMAARIVDPTALITGFADIGGLVDTKRKIYTHIITPLRNHEHFQGDDPLYPKPVSGALFSGPPGTGKTMTARAIAKEAGVNFINISLSDINDKYHGESERLLSALFSVARKIAPAIIFVDEIDGMVGERNALDQSHVYGMKTHFLGLMDGVVTARAPVMVIGCTNNALHMDKAMRRRMPLVIEFELPTATERAAILRTIVRADELASQEGLVRTALLADGFSGSDLENVYREACMARVTALVEGERTDRRLLDVDLDTGLDATAKSMDAHAINHLLLRAGAPTVPRTVASSRATATV